MSEGFTETDTFATHTIFITGVEVKGTTTIDKLAPGEADKGDPRRGIR